MASIDLTSGTAGAYGSGELQLQGKVQMTSTLTPVTDNLNVASPLLLSTTLVQTTSTLKITTNDNPYIDAEDGAGNNRFTVGRATGSQQVNVDFASNPAGSTTAVGAIRTFRDGTNLSEAMTFIEDGSVGIGTTAPVGLLDLYKAAAATRLAIRGDAGQNRLISYRTGAVQRFGLYVNNTAESGSNAGSNFAIRAYSDAGTLLSTPLFITRATGNVGINDTSPEATFSIKSVSSNNSDNLAQVLTNSELKLQYRADDLSSLYIGGLGSTRGYLQGINNTQNAGADISLNPYGGNVGVGTGTPAYKLDVNGSTNSTSANITNTGGNALLIENGGTGFTTGIIMQQAGTEVGRISFPSSTTMTFSVGSAVNTAMVINSSRNVGIGTASPQTLLHLSAGNPILLLEETDQVADAKRWGIQSETSILKFRAFNDALTSAVDVLSLTRAGNAGIGTITPSTKLEISGSDSGDFAALALTNTNQAGTADASTLNFKLGRTADSFLFTIPAIKFVKEQQWTSTGSTVNGALTFSTIENEATSEVARLTSNKFLRMATGTGGIQFNGDTAAANALDDYEEGTFTATLVPGTSGSITLDTATCSYTKIGRQVTVKGQITVASVSSPIGTIVNFNGLPFTIINAQSGRGLGSIMWADAPAGTLSSVVNYHLSNTTTWIFSMTAASVSASDEFYITMTYFV